MLSECFSPAPNQRPLPQIWGLNITMLKLGVGLYQIGGLCSVPKRSEERGVSGSPSSQVDTELPCYRVAPVTTTTMYQGPLRCEALSCEDSMAIPVSFEHRRVC